MLLSTLLLGRLGGWTLLALITSTTIYDRVQKDANKNTKSMTILLLAWKIFSQWFNDFDKNYQCWFSNTDKFCILLFLSLPNYSREQWRGVYTVVRFDPESEEAKDEQHHSWLTGLANNDKHLKLGNPTKSEQSRSKVGEESVNCTAWESTAKWWKDILR